MVEHMILSLTLSGVLPEVVIAWYVIPEYLSPHWKSIPGIGKYLRYYHFFLIIV